MRAGEFKVEVHCRRVTRTSYKKTRYRRFCSCVINSEHVQVYVLLLLLRFIRSVARFFKGI